MGVVNYKEDGKDFWKVYVHVRSRKNRKVRAQKLLIGISSEDEAERLNKRWYQWACSEVAKRENEGLTWGEVIESWREWYRRYPSSRWDQGTVNDYIAITKNWTPDWLDKPMTKLTSAHGFQMIQEARDKGASTQRLYQIKTTVNVIFRWGVQSGKIPNGNQSPVFGIELKKRDDDPLGEIMSRDEVANLLDRAERVNHEWFPIWKVAAYTGMRASELEGLRKSDIELVSREMARKLDASMQETKQYGLIRVQRQWKRKGNDYGPTKGRMARTVPVSSKLYWFLIDYLERNEFETDVHGQRVFPVLAEHKRGNQAAVLKLFCAAGGLRLVKFHTFRACFATHLLAAGVPEVKVMKIGGWRDRETMMLYVRRAGVDEAGATELLDFGKRNVEPLPDVGSNVVNLFQKR